LQNKKKSKIISFEDGLWMIPSADGGTKNNNNTIFAENGYSRIWTYCAFKGYIKIFIFYATIEKMRIKKTIAGAWNKWNEMNFE
jgi:hypothetical protein